MRDKIIIISVAVLAIVIGVLIFLSGKAVPDTSSTVASDQPAAVEVPFTKLVQGVKSSVEERTNYVITSPTELKELWQMIDAKGNPPTVDFKKQVVLAIFAGKEPTTAISIAKIEDTNARLVSIDITKPEGACVAKAPATSLYELAVVPLTSLPLTHADIVTTAKCQN